MSTSTVDRVVAATLYEGYVLYPYRPSSVKNQVRWTFGGVHPRAWSDASAGTEPWTARCECLLRGGAGARVSVHVRFLHLVTRTAARLGRSAAELAAATSGEELIPVAEVEVAGIRHRSWEEARERDVDCGSHALGELVVGAHVVEVAVPAGREVEPLRDADGLVAAALVREHDAVAAELALSAERLAGDLHRVRVVVRNMVDLALTGEGDRERALRRSLVSTHAVLVVEKGTWLSLADPPEDARQAAAGCSNAGLWPVLIGEQGAADTILASPIILGDHPQVAPESAGDLFDATEIDEILTLRILTLTDAEKAEMRAADPRTQLLLERTEALTGDDLIRLHGTIRELRPVREEPR